MMKYYHLAFLVVPIMIIATVVLFFLPNRQSESGPMFKFNTSKDRLIIANHASSSDLVVTSGGSIVVSHGVASTLVGPSPIGVNSLQMVFRAITPQSSHDWTDYQVSVWLIPTRHMISDSREVDGTDGIYVFMHYEDQDNLYVAGISKDGRIFIKRKTTLVDGTTVYGLIAQETIFSGTYVQNGNLITPFEGAHIHLLAKIVNTRDGSVQISVTVEIYQNGELVLSHQLDGVDAGQLSAQGTGQALGEPLLHGRAGLRLDSIEAIILDFTVDNN
jgi:hypothetical protein